MGSMIEFVEVDYIKALHGTEKVKIVTFAMFRIVGYLRGWWGGVKLDLFDLTA